MYQLLYLLRDVIALRRGPQDAPYSPPLLVALCLGSLALQLAIARVLKVEGETLGAGIVALVFNLGLLYLLLNLRKLTSRFVQAALTLLGVAMLFQLLSLPIVLLAGGHPPSAPDHLTPVQALLGVVSLPILIWKLVVDAHVLRNSLDLPFASGLVIAICWIIAELILGAALGGAAPPAA
jgi:hypothetical protein